MTTMQVRSHDAHRIKGRAGRALAAVGDAVRRSTLGSAVCELSSTLGRQASQPERHHCVSWVEVERPPDLPHSRIAAIRGNHNQCGALA